MQESAAKGYTIVTEFDVIVQDLEAEAEAVRFLVQNKHERFRHLKLLTSDDLAKISDAFWKVTHL